MKVTLRDFAAAAETGGKIRLRNGDEEKGLHATGSRWKFWRVFTGDRTTVWRLPSGEIRKRNRETVNVFLREIGREYGTSGLMAAEGMLTPRSGVGRPLLAGFVKRVIRHLESRGECRCYRGNREIVDRFFRTPGESESPFDRLVAALPDREVRESLDRWTLDVIRGDLRRFLLEDDRAGRGGCRPMDFEEVCALAGPNLRELAVRAYDCRVRDSFSTPGRKEFDDAFEGMARQSGVVLSPAEADLGRLKRRIMTGIESRFMEENGAWRPVSRTEAMNVALDRIRAYLNGMRPLLDAVDGALRIGEVTGSQRNALRAAALRYEKVWELLDRIPAGWAVKGRMAQCIVPVVEGVSPGDRDSGVDIRAAAILANSWRRIAGEDGGESVTPAWTWRAVFGEQAPGDLALRDLAGTMDTAALDRFERRYGETPPLNDPRLDAKACLHFGVTDGCLPFPVLMDRFGGSRALEIGDLAAPPRLRCDGEDLGNGPKQIRVDLDRWRPPCRISIGRRDRSPLEMDPPGRLAGKAGQAYREEIEAMGEELVRAVRDLSAGDAQARTANLFLTQAPGILYKNAAKGLLGDHIDEHILSRFEIMPEGNDALRARVATGEDGPVDFRMEARIEADGNYAVDVFHLVRNPGWGGTETARSGADES
ncbi:MAG TPA: hypothetical protein PKY58_04405 [Syntrophales bacterium]|nr:hypothetical protein [Syntrophales bacterium]HQB29596.1 hypothetical protein [Syntrophales bacterium]HQN77407.1 hypothetical protein [Syntrophales bacterium]HQQ26746.1 hypothetical protein [Syntrophales bacterium]